MKYQGYTAQIEIDETAGILFGRVLDIKDTITFQGNTVKELSREFHDQRSEQRESAVLRDSPLGGFPDLKELSRVGVPPQRECATSPNGLAPQHFVQHALAGWVRSTRWGQKRRSCAIVSEEDWGSFASRKRSCRLRRLVGECPRSNFRKKAPYRSAFLSGFLIRRVAAPF